MSDHFTALRSKDLTSKSMPNISNEDVTNLSKVIELNDRKRYILRRSSKESKIFQPTNHSIKKETPTPVFSFEFCEFFNITFSYRTPPKTASVNFLVSTLCENGLLSLLSTFNRFLLVGFRSIGRIYANLLKYCK